MAGESLLRLFKAPPKDLRAAFFDNPADVLAGNSVGLLNDGAETYPAMREAIASARQTVHLESYILRSDRTGWSFARLLAERARAGVSVRVLFDAVGSMGLADDYLQFLRNNGIPLLEYRPIAPWRRRWGLGKRDHRKILVVDGRVAFTGGINVSDEYLDLADGGGGWRDVDLRVEGPAARELDRLFRATWTRETGRWFPLPGRPTAAPGAVPLRVAANLEYLHRHRIRRAYLHALARARESVTIANAYFIPDAGIRRALYQAVRRGVRARVLVPEASDVPAVTYASERLFEGHLKAGVRLFAWPRTMMHAKTVVVDSVWCAVGSYNMDHRSLLHNLEVNVHVLDDALGRAMEAAFERDAAASRELKLDEWRRRPLRRKLLEQVFYLARYWL